MTYTYNYGYNTPAATTAVGLGIGVIIAYVVFTLAICAFSIIVLWKIFTKAGKEGSRRKPRPLRRPGRTAAPGA